MSSLGPSGNEGESRTLHMAGNVSNGGAIVVISISQKIVRQGTASQLEPPERIVAL